MISIVIPALNERDSIVDTVVQVRSILEEHGLSPYEIIVVDDGSTDGTGTLAENAGSRVVSHPHNIGYGRALKNGIAAAMHDTIVITDADGSYPLDKIPELFHRYQEGFDMVVGARTGPYFRESALKEPLRVLLRWIVEFTAGRRIPDINSGLRVFSKRTVTRYFNHLSDRFSFTTSLTLAYMMNSKFVCYEEIDYYRRSGKSKVRLFRDSLRTTQYILEAATYYNPFKIFFAAGILMFLISIASVVGGVILQLVSAFLLAVGAILAGLMVFAMGLLAVLLKQIMDRGSNGRLGDL